MGGGAVGALASLRWRAKEELSRCLRTGSRANLCCAALSVHAGGFGGQPGSLGSGLKGTRGPMAYSDGLTHAVWDGIPGEGAETLRGYF